MRRIAGEAGIKYEFGWRSSTLVHMHTFDFFFFFLANLSTLILVPERRDTCNHLQLVLYVSVKEAC